MTYKIKRRLDQKVYGFIKYPNCYHPNCSKLQGLASLAFLVGASKTRSSKVYNNGGVRSTFNHGGKDASKTDGGPGFAIKLKASSVIRRHD